MGKFNSSSMNIILGLVFCTFLQFKNVECASDMCKLCSCTNATIDCSSRNLELNITDTAWPKDVKTAIFDDNFLSEISEFPVSALENLSLQNNRISVIEEKAFRNLENLRKLNLSDNQLTSNGLPSKAFAGNFDPELFEPLSSVVILDLSMNKIESINQELFVHLPNLQELYLSNNPFHSIDDNTRKELSTIPFLEVLDLSFTQIDSLPEYFLHGSLNLKTLNLEGNLFKAVPSQFISDGHELVNIILDNNPIEEEPATEENSS